jgi:hypothetical protein
LQHYHFDYFLWAKVFLRIKLHPEDFSLEAAPLTKGGGSHKRLYPRFQLILRVCSSVIIQYIQKLDLPESANLIPKKKNCFS